jgi:magnesium-transporting ATPase (P-type)
MSPPNADEMQSTIVGLTTQEAEARLNQFGPNEPTVTRHHSALADLWHEFTNPLVLILVIAAVASAFLGQKYRCGNHRPYCSDKCGYRLRSDLSLSTRYRSTARQSCPHGNRSSERAVERNSAA